MLFIIFYLMWWFVTAEAEPDDANTNWYVIGSGIATVLTTIATNFGTFWLTRKKYASESNKMDVEALASLYSVYEKVRANEDKARAEKRDLEDKLNDCIDKNSGCVDCLGTVKKFLDGYNGGDANSKELRKIIEEALSKHN